MNQSQRQDTGIINTNWHVITGAPCSGKTTLIKALEKKGFHVIHEASREYFEKKQSEGIAMEQMFDDSKKVESEILNMRIDAERKNPREQLTFIDRGIPDSIAYCRRFGQCDQEAIKASALFRYRSVFLLERLLFQCDGLRYEDDRTAERLEAMIESAYRDAGYPLILVPLVPVEKRLNLILAHIGIPCSME